MRSSPKFGFVVICGVLVPLCFFLTASLVWTQRTNLQGVVTTSIPKPMSRMNSNNNNSSWMMTTAAWGEQQGGVILSLATEHESNSSTDQVVSQAKPLQLTLTAMTISNNTLKSNNTQKSNNSSNNNSYVDQDMTDETTIITTFHRWNSTSGIDIVPLWEYIHSLEDPPLNNTSIDPYGPLPGFIFSNASLYISTKVLYRQRRRTIEKRSSYVGPFFQQALHDLYQNFSTSNNNTMFPYLTQALQDGGLPLVFHLADFVGCLEQNYNFTSKHDEANFTLVNMPMLTMCSSPTCQYAFPIPSYTTLKLAKRNALEWNATFQKSNVDYPWHTKLRKAVWRGVPTDRGKWNTSILDIPRVFINTLAKDHPDVLDVAMICKKRRCQYAASWRPWIIIGDFIPFADFQKYRAVLDLDGSSWSERFPRLLCQNSVVIKMDPEQIDYFWPTLQAGVHYLAANLSTILSVVQRATSDDHQQEMQQIVANAHEWCRQRMVIRQLQLDILSVLDGYARELYKNRRDWHRYMTNTSGLDLAYPPAWSQHPLSVWSTETTWI